jgi:hypothetical protein
MEIKWQRYQTNPQNNKSGELDHSFIYGKCNFMLARNQIKGNLLIHQTESREKEAHWRKHTFLLSTYEIWKVLVSLAKIFFFFIANFHVLGLFIPKKRV